jgi:hypothetical protein
MTKVTISIIAEKFDNGTLGLFSSLAALGIAADVRLYCTDKSVSLIYETIANNIRSLSPANKSELVYIASDTPEAVLKGIKPADIVIIENKTPGLDGLLIKKLAPDAWYIYRGEEAHVFMTELAADFPGIKLLLSDDQTDSVRDLLYDVVRSKMKIDKPRHRDLIYSLSGIPYFCFLTGLRYDGVSLDSMIRSFAEDFPEDYRLSFYKTYGMLPAAGKDSEKDAAARSDADLKKLLRSLQYGEAVLPVGIFTESALVVKSLTGGGNLVTDVGIIQNGKVIMTSALIQKNVCRILN